MGWLVPSQAIAQGGFIDPAWAGVTPQPKPELPRPGLHEFAPPDPDDGKGASLAPPPRTNPFDPTGFDFDPAAPGPPGFSNPGVSVGFDTPPVFAPVGGPLGSPAVPTIPAPGGAAVALIGLHRLLAVRRRPR